jgi:hypothetical protein
MSLFDVPLQADSTDRETKMLVFRPSAVYKVRGFSLYLLNVSLEHLSDESMLEAPYRIRIAPRRAAPIQPIMIDRIPSGVSTR